MTMTNPQKICEQPIIYPLIPTGSSLYWMWEKELLPELCQDIIDRAGGDFEEGRLIRDEGSELDDNVRKTNLHWNSDEDLFDIAFKYMEIANKKAGWNLEIDAAENFQIGQFPEGGHYDWHIDGGGTGSIQEPQNKIRHGKTRKISMVVWLNEGFEGGDFEFHQSYLKDNVLKPTQGTIIMFPSWIMHRVTPITKGTRYSLVSWFLGKPIE